VSVIALQEKCDEKGLGDGSGQRSVRCRQFGWGPLAHSARADIYRRLGRTAEARSSYEKALALTQQEPERQFLQERIRQLK
jgi:predicted negative regulator of RcsB-dependent stress response